VLFPIPNFSEIAKMNQQQDVQPEDPANPGLNGQQNHGHLHNEIEALRSQMGQMAEEAKAQKALEKVHLQTIVEFHAIVEKQQANGVSAKLNALRFPIFNVIINF
jgi:tRNA U34 5-carboxymethylaminomethyl modifying enzyme MnmG/GidA